MENKIPVSGKKTNRPLDPEDSFGTVDAWHTNNFGSDWEKIPYDQLSQASASMLGVDAVALEAMTLDELSGVIHGTNAPAEEPPTQ